MKTKYESMGIILELNKNNSRQIKCHGCELFKFCLYFYNDGRLPVAIYKLNSGNIVKKINPRENVYMCKDCAKATLKRNGLIRR